MNVEMLQDSGQVRLTSAAGEVMVIPVMEFWSICQTGAVLDVKDEIASYLSDGGEVGGIDLDTFNTHSDLADKIVERVLDLRASNENGDQIYNAICACVRESKTITTNMIQDGIESGLVRLIESPNGDGVACAIGDNWFYFGGSEAEQSSLEEFKKNVPQDVIVKDIVSTLNSFSVSGVEFYEEYLYYAAFLSEHLNDAANKQPVYKVEVSVDVVGANHTPLEFSLLGDDVYELKRGIASSVKQVCADNGYSEGVVLVDVIISKNGKYYDSDFGEFDLRENLFLFATGDTFDAVLQDATHRSSEGATNYHSIENDMEKESR